MSRYSRRQLLRAGLALTGLSVLSGCEMPGQQAAKVATIGFLAVGSREGFRTLLIESFRQGLREHGYVEGQNIAIEYRFSEDNNDRLPALAAELVALKVQLILVRGRPQPLRPSRPPARSPSSRGPSPPIRSTPDSSPASRARAATSRE
jgi:ABC-type uncharacterized transport system substrate-binding protein